ncbi:MAG: VWA domain-containing protein [Kiritimatiellia bacterium]
MKFVYPWMLILVALVPLAGAFWVWLRARAERRLDGLVAPSLQRRLMPRNPGLFNLQAALLLTGLFLAVFAAARPQWGHSTQKMQARTRNVVVALDVSRSMLAADVHPNRLERAKADVADLIDSLEGDRCALVAFRRTGVLLCPLTTDHAFLRSALEGATPDSAPRGETDLGSAIKTSLDALDPAADDHNAILLISDGGDLRGGALDAARVAAKRNVPIFTVGLGDPRTGSGIPAASGAGAQQYKGQKVVTKLEEAALVEIARASGGRYVPLATAGTAETTLGNIYRKFLRQVAAKEQAEEEELRATERFGVFLVPGLLLMLVAGFLSRGRFAGKRTRALVAATCLVLCMGLAAEEAPEAAAKPAPEAAYVPPAESALSDREIWNKGYDYWKAGDMTNALATLRGLTLSRTHGARAAEVVGTILHATRGAELAQAKSAAGVHAEGAALEPLRRACKAGEESAGVMQLALRAQPDDPRANRNYTRAVTGLRELRDEVHVEDVLAQAKGRDPKEMMTEAAREALALLRAQEGVLTNEAAVAVRQSESLARRAEKLADALIPLKRQVLETVTNEQQAATIVGDVEATRDATLRAAEQLADLSADAAVSLAQAETAFHRYWKGMLDPPTALTEGLRAQTNAVAKAARENGRDWQQEAADFSQVFNAGFPQWAQQTCAQDLPAASNKPPFTAEVAQAVAVAMQEIAKQQAAQLKDPTAEAQAQILTGLNRVQERCGLIAGQPPQLNAAGILAQTNAYLDVKRPDGFDWQSDAWDATRAFRAKFPAWAQRKAQEIQQKIQQGNTNAVPFTKEAQDEIARLAAEVEAKQARMVKTALPPEQLEILSRLERIRELLPKDDGGGSNNPNPQQSPQQNKDQQEKNDEQDQQRNDAENQQDQPQPEEQKEQKEQPDEPKDQKDVEELLRKAQERSDEHENEKKARMNKSQLAPNERDW